jgi:DNA-binding MarR family transcriptional regulator
MHHYLVMVALVELARPTQTDISKALNIDTGNLVALLNDLEEKDYLARTPDPANRRRNIVQITTIGRQALTHLDHLTDQANNALLEPLTTAERDQLRTLLSRIIGNRSSD